MKIWPLMNVPQLISIVKNRSAKVTNNGYNKKRISNFAPDAKFGKFFVGWIETGLIYRSKYTRLKCYAYKRPQYKQLFVEV
jgi:hypothetical protein